MEAGEGMMARAVLAGTVAIATFLLCGSASQGSMDTYFAPADISYEGSGLYAVATASVTTGPGYVDVLIRNVSPRQDDFEGGGGSANPFITEVVINLYEYGLVAGPSHVSSTDDAWFAQGPGEAAVQLGQLELNYKIKTKSDSQGNLLAKATIVCNDNVIAGLAALDDQHVPQEDSSAGFLNPSPHEYSGAVFDSAVFHFCLDTIEIPDEALWGAGTITVKYQGDEYSMRVTNTPEPVSVLVFAIGAWALLPCRRRK